jgi:hypothetical protein
MTVSPRPTILALAVLLSAAPFAALADAIDGTWCSPDGARTLQIAGPDYTTPAGNRTVGTYRRHDGSYTVPEGEAGAGGTMVLQMLNEDEMRVSPPDAPPETWLRCQLNT